MGKRYTVREKGITVMGKITFAVFDSLRQMFLEGEMEKEIALAQCKTLNRTKGLTR